jgi:hypothetical protein
MKAFQCPSCKATIKAPDAMAGKRARCPKCGALSVLPLAGEPFPIAPEPPPTQAPNSGFHGRTKPLGIGILLALAIIVSIILVYSLPQKAVLPLPDQPATQAATTTPPKPHVESEFTQKAKLLMKDIDDALDEYKRLQIVIKRDEAQHKAEKEAEIELDKKKKRNKLNMWYLEYLDSEFRILSPGSKENKEGSDPGLFGLAGF